MNTTAIRLQELRRSRGLTQEQTARLINDIDVRRWKSYEYGDRNMPLDILKATAELFNVTTDYLLGLSDEMQPQAKEFQKSTGLSESAISNLSRFNDYPPFMDCMNQFLSSEDFLNAIYNILIAKTPAYNIKTQADIERSVSEGLKLLKISQGKKKHISDEKITLMGSKIKEWELWQASKNLNKVIDRIVKGEKDNGTCETEL